MGNSLEFLIIQLPPFLILLFLDFSLQRNRMHIISAVHIGISSSTIVRRISIKSMRSQIFSVKHTSIEPLLITMIFHLKKSNDSKK